jgi:hypothetical protein
LTSPEKLAERKRKARELVLALLDRELERDRGHVRIAFAWKHDCVKLARIEEHDVAEPIAQQERRE